MVGQNQSGGRKTDKCKRKAWRRESSAGLFAPEESSKNPAFFKEGFVTFQKKNGLSIMKAERKVVDYEGSDYRIKRCLFEGCPGG